MNRNEISQEDNGFDKGSGKNEEINNQISNSEFNIKSLKSQIDHYKKLINEKSNRKDELAEGNSEVEIWEFIPSPEDTISYCKPDVGDDPSFTLPDGLYKNCPENYSMHRTLAKNFEGKLLVQAKINDKFCFHQNANCVIEDAYKGEIKEECKSSTFKYVEETSSRIHERSYYYLTTWEKDQPLPSIEITRKAKNALLNGASISELKTAIGIHEASLKKTEKSLQDEEMKLSGYKSSTNG